MKEYYIRKNAVLFWWILWQMLILAGKADLPIHCTRWQVLGTWTIKIFSKSALKTQFKGDIKYFHYYSFTFPNASFG